MEDQTRQGDDLQTDGDSANCSRRKVHPDMHQTKNTTTSGLKVQHNFDEDRADSACVSNFCSEDFESGVLSHHECTENSAESQNVSVCTTDRRTDVECIGSSNVTGGASDLHVCEEEEDDDEGVCLSSVTEEFNNLDIEERAFQSHFVTPNLHTVQSSKCENVNDRITSDSLLVFGKDADGDTLLHIAIIQCCIDLALKFIRIAPWYDWLDIFNENLRQTPLHLAVITRLKPVVRRLMVGGANVEMRDHNGDTPLHIACRRGHLDIVEVLLQPIKLEEYLVNEYDVPYQRIPQNLDLLNYDGFTCLHVAAEHNHVDILLYLLDKGSNINAGDGKSGKTLLHFAAENNNIELTKILLQQRSVNIDAKSYNGCTPIMYANARSNSEVVRLLTEAGANTSCLDDSEYSDSDDED